MKKYIYIFIIFISFGVTAQTQTNVFDDTAEMSERKDNSDAYSEVPEKEPEIAYNIGNPGEPVPIDDYIPLLLMVAAGLIIYKTYHRKSLSR